MSKATTTKATKVTAPAVKEATEIKVEAIVIDTASIIKALPEIVTPSVLAKHYMMNDGGKLIRRHLRKYFAENHVYNEKWSWLHADTNLPKVIEYLEPKYAIPTKTKTA